MDGQRIHPEERGELGVADGDVAGETEGVVFAGPVAEERGHVVEGPEAVGGESGVGGDSWREWVRGSVGGTRKRGGRECKIPGSLMGP